MNDEQPTPGPAPTQPEPTNETEPTIVVEPAAMATAILDPSVQGNVIEELVPASRRRPKHERGERPLLEVEGLRTSFYTREGVVHAVDGIDFHVDRGEIMGLVGE